MGDSEELAARERQEEPTWDDVEEAKNQGFVKGYNKGYETGQKSTVRTFS